MKTQLFAAGHIRSAAVGALTLAALSTVTHAQLLSGGNSGIEYSPGTGSTLPTDTINYTLEDTATGTFPGGQSIGATGTVTEWVYLAQDVTTSTTTMDYFYQVTNTNASDPIRLFTTQVISPTNTEVTGFALQAGIGLPGANGGNAPVTGTVEPLYLLLNNGDEFSAAFQVSDTNGNGTLGPGGGNQLGPDSVLFGFTTTNLLIGSGTASVTEGGTANFANFYLPVPEPNAPIFGFALLGVIGVGMLRRVRGFKSSEMMPIKG